MSFVLSLVFKSRVPNAVFLSQLLLFCVLWDVHKLPHENGPAVVRICSSLQYASCAKCAFARSWAMFGSEPSSCGCSEPWVRPRRLFGWKFIEGTGWNPLPPRLHFRGFGQLQHKRRLGANFRRPSPEGTLQPRRAEPGWKSSVSSSPPGPVGTTEGWMRRSPQTEHDVSVVPAPLSANQGFLACCR